MSRDSRRILEGFGALVSFEVLMVLFLFCGVFKTDPRFAWFPLDLTAVFFCATLLSGGRILLSDSCRPCMKNRGPAMAAFLLFVGYNLLTLCWSPSREYAASKAFYLSTLSVWAFAAGLWIVSSTDRRMGRLMTALVVFSLWVALEALFAHLKNPAAEFVLAFGGERGGYLCLSGAIGPGVVVLGVYSAACRLGVARRCAVVCLLGFLLFVLMRIGGRRDALFSVLAVVTTWAPSLLDGLTSLKLGGPAKRQILTACLVACPLIAVTAANPDIATVRRLEVLAQEPGGGTSAAWRTNAWEHAVSLWAEAPVLGHGIGAWPVLMGIADAREYPHNIILESAVESGLVGAGLLVLLLLQACVVRLCQPRCRHLRYAMVIFALAFYRLCNAMISGDISTIRVEWFFWGLAIGYGSEAIWRDSAGSPSERVPSCASST